jgi:hypothetical protein
VTRQALSSTSQLDLKANEASSSGGGYGSKVNSPGSGMYDGMDEYPLSPGGGLGGHDSRRQQFRMSLE